MNNSPHEILLPISIEEYLRSHRIDELKKYLEVTEKYLERAKIDFETSANDQAKKLARANPDLRDDEINDILADDYWRYAETFPRILRSSFLVSIFSIFENNIKQLCAKIKEERNIPINLDNLNGNLLQRLKMFCKLASLSISFDRNHWNEINNYYMVRHCIVHNNGFIPNTKDEKKLLIYAKGKNIVDREIILPSIRPVAVIAPSEQFCKDVIETMQQFWVELEKKVKDIT